MSVLMGQYLMADVSNNNIKIEDPFCHRFLILYGCKNGGSKFSSLLEHTKCFNILLYNVLLRRRGGRKKIGFIIIKQELHPKNKIHYVLHFF